MSASVAIAIAGVDSRITQIRGRIASLTRSSSAANTNGAVGTASAASFDPFGAAYQQALLQASGSSSTNSSQSGGSSGGFSTGDNSYRVEGGVAVRVPGRAPRASGVATSGVATSGVATSGVASAGIGAPPAAGARGSLSGTDVAQMAYNAGFRGDDLVDVVAISKRESGWKPTAFNGNSGTGDRSYGLMQINMIGSLGPARLQQFGLTSNEQLFDPQTNLNAAFVLYQRSGNTLQPWGGYKGMSNTFGTDVDAARQVVAAAGLADAT